ncbi:hypothetical protein BJY01DRAFT_131497 [Aspergillus pseudoustus]|uniref:Zn(2)-C6 fungal-type domain-containing protein n=1 Tax=Aspergillus pseudoustus TaxID=1810923 RepID=A0ABR4IP27_9EURO
MSSPSNSNQAAPVDKVVKPREKFRTSCDACAASKVRCSKEQPRCVRCVQHDHKCVYGRSRRKGKPPGTANRASLQAPQPRQSTRGSGPASVLPPGWSGGNRWHLADMFADTSYTAPVLDHPMQGGWEEIVNSMVGSATHERTVPTHSTPELYSVDFQALLSFSSPGPGPGLSCLRGEQAEMIGEIALDTTLDESSSEAEEDDYEGGMDLEPERGSEPYETAHETCIAAACQTLSSLYQAVRTENRSPDSSARPSSLQRSPSSDVVVSTARAATQTVLRLLRCACSSAHDPSLLSLLATIISKIIAWYQLLYHHSIASASTRASSTENTSHREESGGGDASSATAPSSASSSAKQDHLYNVPLSIGTLRLPHATEMKLKAQLLLCELEPVVDASQLFTARVRSSEVTWGERVICAEFDTQIQQRVGDLKKLLTGVCSLECPSDQI